MVGYTPKSEPKAKPLAPNRKFRSSRLLISHQPSRNLFPCPSAILHPAQILRYNSLYRASETLNDIVTARETQVANRLEGKVAAITGGDQGIGRAIVERFANEGADVALCYRSNKAGADEVVALVQKLGRKAAAFQADVGRVDQGQKFITDAVAALGRIDILVNNAGLERRADFWDVTEADYDLVLDVNLKGPFFVTQAFVNHRRQAKAGGKIINISSVHEELPFPHFTSYCASKGGIKMFTRNLSIELAPLGITINNIAPGAIETPINKNLLNDPAKLKPLLENIPLNRLGKPEDVAGIAAFLASTDSDYMTGTTVVVDGGLTWNYEEQ
jgi:glucose 1-dehydrogenase